MRKRNAHRGYVLVMTLLLLALAAVALSAVAAESHARATQALRAQEQLQRHWGALSCQHALLPNVAAIIEAARRQPDGAGPSLLKLGGQTFVLVFGDEQAKVNLNTLSLAVGTSGVRSALQRLIKTNADEISIHLSPSVVQETGADGKPVDRLKFLSFGQVFDKASPAALMGNDAGTLRGFATNLTCWGDGKLNFTKASPATIAEVASCVLKTDDAVRFRRAQQKSPQLPWDDIFRQQALPAELIPVMGKLMTNKSTCFSLWIAADIKGRPIYQFAVQADGQPPSVFEW